MHDWNTAYLQHGGRSYHIVGWRYCHPVCAKNGCKVQAERKQETALLYCALCTWCELKVAAFYLQFHVVWIIQRRSRIFVKYTMNADCCVSTSASRWVTSARDFFLNIYALKTSCRLFTLINMRTTWWRALYCDFSDVCHIVYF